MLPNSFILCWLDMEWQDLVYSALSHTFQTKPYNYFVWIKPSAQGLQPGHNLDTATEFAWYARKGNPLLNEERVKNWTMQSAVRRVGRHPTEKPVPVYEYLLRPFGLENSKVLSLFAGAGNLGLAAHNKNMDPTLVDIDPQWRDDFDRRVHEAKRPYR